MNRLRNHPPPKVKSPLFDIEHDMLQISKLLGHLFLTTVHKSHFKPTNAQLIFKRFFLQNTLLFCIKFTYGSQSPTHTPSV